MLGGIGMSELIVIMLIILLLFGAKRLPEIGSSLGRGIREFKKTAKEITTEVDLTSEEKEAPNKTS